tara:strand:- start:826 stop:1260 length:435 start_codon:yes stop_codon:yes gene_type:complete
MTRLTSRQKELLQEDKYNLVDTIVLLEHKLAKAVEEIQFLNNEMLLIGEAHIKAQEELDNKKEPPGITKEQNDKFHDDLNDAIAKSDEEKLLFENPNHNKAEDIFKELDRAWEGEISSNNFVDTVTKIFTGDYYVKDKKQTSTD